MTTNYKYKAVESLTTCDTESFKFVNICCYFVNTSHENAFLSYLLEKNGKNEYSFPSIQNNTQLLQNVCDYFVLNIYENIHFKSYEIKNGELFAFFELTINGNNGNNNCKTIISKFEKCLIYEILNIKSINNYKISEFVIEFFINNSSFCYLYDINDRLIEIPIVAFQVVEKVLCNYIYYNEILLDPDNNFYKLNLFFSLGLQNGVSLRYAVFIGSFISVVNINLNKIDFNLEKFDTIISAKDKQVYFKNRFQQVLL
jgi:hypothetical protein